MGFSAVAMSPFCGSFVCSQVTVKMSQHRNSSARVSQMLLRVTDNGKMTLTTPQSKDSSGLRKLSLARSMSGTSERKTSFFGKRTSGTGMTRTSQFGVFGGSEKIKDPRPLHDKAFVQQCIRQLCEVSEFAVQSVLHWLKSNTRVLL
nr:PREDICTED: kinetochore protein NDC80 homolog isoform X1 [Latimeria chalumnae]|eukprot:XP_014351113.1 PREDICTED: kinetochore protein NDC80 homolog isoform X1 [Latimeria chalumnae]